MKGGIRVEEMAAGRRKLVETYADKYLAYHEMKQTVAGALLDDTISQREFERLAYDCAALLCELKDRRLELTRLKMDIERQRRAES